MKILFISLEFSAGTFSGNGVLAQSQVRALTQEGHQVFVISARPPDWTGAPNPQGATGLHEVPVSKWGHLDASAPWTEFADGCCNSELHQHLKAFAPDLALGVDWTSLEPFHYIRKSFAGLPYVYLNYRVFSRTSSSKDRPLVSSKEKLAMEEAIDTIVLARCDSEYMREHLLPSSKPSLVPKVLLPPLRSEMLNTVQHTQACLANFNSTTQPSQSTNSTSSTATLLIDQSDRTTLNAPINPQNQGPSFQNLNSPNHVNCNGDSNQAMLSSSAASTLTNGVASLHNEEATCAGLLSSSSIASNGHAFSSCAPESSCKHASANSDADAGACSVRGAGSSCSTSFEQSRPYITCCVRLSEEKEPFRFVDVVIELQKRGSLQRHGITPLLIGSAKDEYAQELKDTLRSKVPNAVILEHFLGPADLAHVYRQTRLNVHPCSYDAYGMTIVEAASQGAPSLVNSGGTVGATDLLLAERREVYLTDIQAPPQELANVVEQLLESPLELCHVAKAAEVKARSWDEEANVRQLVCYAESALKGNVGG